MTSIAEKNKYSVIKVVQVLLLEEENKSEITPALIAEKIAAVLSLHKKWGEELDQDAVIDELIRRFSIWLGQDTSLFNNIGHIDWLSSDRKENWRYWQRYREWQEEKLPWSAIKGLDSTSDEILGLLEDPLRDGPWDRRGLVVGHVQSGKTGNYTGLINKAADAGYKIIIVLAGMHNNLRSQTQMRLDEGFLGYETSPTPKDLKIIGVGKIDSDLAIRPNYATNRSERGDFNAGAAQNMGITPEQRPWLFVVKKNKSVLDKLHTWITNHVANTTCSETGRKIVTHLPLLIIDDEADHASVDTGEQLFGEDGKPDDEHQPKAINKLIRKILHTFQRKAYVGYTATPFANIFIHARGETKEEGPDLFPSAFIINLAAPSNYVGPARVFGLNTGEQREYGLPLPRTIDDQCSEDGKSGWMPTKHRNGHVPSSTLAYGMPASLVEAINAFILSCSVRQLRGQGHQHCSMLIHVTRFNSVQKKVHSQVTDYIHLAEQRLSREIGHEEILSQLHKLWVNDFIPTTIGMSEIAPDLVFPPELKWEEIAAILPSIFQEISIRMINGTAKDALDYADSAHGLKVIAIGGDKLARGLTLEGLCISYFLRASRMYDTLMQMGRWFGYRTGYLDLCRLYTTTDLIEWFEHIADASEELREEFEIMAASGGTPADYGLKVVSHPVLMVTSRLKMRSAHTLKLSFSGSIVETVSFSKNPTQINSNMKALEVMIYDMGKAIQIPSRKRNESVDNWNGAFWEKVPFEVVTKFLGSYKTHEQSLKVNSNLLRTFIETIAKEGELTSWSVAFIGGSVEENKWAVDSDISVQRTKRTGKKMDDRYAIRRLLSPKDEGIDLDELEWNSALEETRKNSKEQTIPNQPNGISMRKVRGFGAKDIQAHPERGVLLIYLLDPKASSDLNPDLNPIVAFGISFPGSNSIADVEYRVNNVLWEQEYGAAD